MKDMKMLVAGVGVLAVGRAVLAGRDAEASRRLAATEGSLADLKRVNVGLAARLKELEERPEFGDPARQDSGPCVSGRRIRWLLRG